MRIGEAYCSGSSTDAAEDEPRPRRAGARQDRPRRRRVGHAVHRREGPAARLQQGPAGDPGAAVRRGRDRRCVASRSRAAWSRASCSTPARLRAAVDAGHLVATELADYLVAKGVPFRDAHDIAGHWCASPTSAGSSSAALTSTSCARRTRRSTPTSPTGSTRRAPSTAATWSGGPARERVLAEIDRIAERAGVQPQRMSRTRSQYQTVGELHCEDVALANIAEDGRHAGLRLLAAASSSARTARSTTRSTGIPHRDLLRGQGELDARRAQRAGPARRGRRHRVGRRAVPLAARRRQMPSKVVFSGVGKTEAEMKAALEAGIGCFNVESAEELVVLDRGRAVARQARADLAARQPRRRSPRPTRTSRPASRRTSSASRWRRRATLFRDARQAAAASQVIGVDCHIGSQLTKTAPFTDAIARLVALVHELAKDGIKLEHVDIGGGLGIDYGKGEGLPPSPAEYGAAVQARARAARRPRAHADHRARPRDRRRRRRAAHARALPQAQRGQALHDRRRRDERSDAARAVRLVPSDPARCAAPTARAITTDVVGPICETGDFFARDRELPALEPASCSAIGAAGAYGAAMASNYNTRPRAPEVLVPGDSLHRDPHPRDLRAARREREARVGPAPTSRRAPLDDVAGPGRPDILGPWGSASRCAGSRCARRAATTAPARTARAATPRSTTAATTRSCIPPRT